MLLSITTTHRPATDLGRMLHKRPDRFQSFGLTFGRAHVFYPEAADDRCTACLLLDVDPVDLVRGKGIDRSGPLDAYVNDRPYVASSFLCVALAEVFGTALAGRCVDRPELAATPIPLEIRLAALPVRGGERFLRAMFEPLGYEVEADRLPLDETFPEWGDSPYHAVALRTTATLAAVLTHLYVLIPVFDNRKHYFVGEGELEKLLSKGAGWLAEHPEKEEIARRYLKHRPSLTREALARLVPEEPTESTDDAAATERPEERLERPLSLNEQRLGAVLAALRGCGAKRVLDLGCGEGKLLAELARDRRFEEVVGLDVSIRSLEIAARKLRLDHGDSAGDETGRVRLLHGSLTYRDARLAGFDAAAVVEVVEHLDPPRLTAFERTLFESARPRSVVLTTPNREYNVVWESLGDRLRHPDHRFEWTRPEFRAWAESVATRFGYAVRFAPIGPVHETLGPPTQMAVFERAKVVGDGDGPLL